MLNYAVVQLGYCVFGAGETTTQAYEEAARWMDEDTQIDNESGEETTSPMTPPRVEALCDDGRRNRVHGATVLIDSDHPEFDSYMKNQGCYKKTKRGWMLA